MPLNDQQGLEVETQPPGVTEDGAIPEAGQTDDTDSTPPSSSGSETTDQSQIDGPASLEDAIAAALETDPDGSTATPEAKTTDADAEDEDETSDKAQAPADKSDGTVEDGSTGKDDDPSDEEIAALRPKAQKRVRQLLDQRNEARQQAEALQGDASNYQQIRTFMEANSLADKEVADLFRLGADLKSGNPERLGKFLDRVMPFVQQAMIATGRALPNDLQQQVDAGDMTEDVARTMSRTRTQAEYASQQAQAARQREAQTQTQVVQGQIASAVETWQQQTSQNDPDFGVKAPAMQRIAQAMVAQRGLPKTPAEAVEFAKAAYAEASQLVKSARPAPKPSRPAPTSQAAPRSGLAPQATSLEAIINQALDG